MRVLLVNPIYPDTFWGFKYALRFIEKRASYPPLGLLTVAALLPAAWEMRLVDMNVAPLRDEDIRWADLLFLGAMSVQQKSAREVIARGKALGVTVVAGGPLFTTYADEFPEVDHLVLNEAEITLPRFLDDLRHGHAAHLYSSEEKADLRLTPLPRWDLITMRRYAAMNIQFSRGCPFDCEFCDITVQLGRVPRTKETAQILAELDALYTRGWRGTVFFVDDNFIGNKAKIKNEVLPALITWMAEHSYPFTFLTEASINLADDPELMRLLVQAKFGSVFVGIESPNKESLDECRKIQNSNRDLIASVRKIQQAGLRVHAGFILGFDHDPLSIFERLIDFIQESEIVIAMVGLLNAPRGTRLYQRLQQEGRILSDMSGNNTDMSTNILPRMDMDTLLDGYQRVLATIYAPRQYYTRVKQYLQHHQPVHAERITMNPVYLRALCRSIVLLGMLGRERRYYWKLFFWSLFTRPRQFPLAITLAVFGYHFRKLFEQHVSRVSATGC